MAWENFGWVWNVVGVQGSEYNVLIFLADQANAKGVTPLLRVEKIMRRCNLARRSVFTYLLRLEAKGFIRRQRQLAADGSFDANVYNLDLKRFFPKGVYNEAAAMWEKILNRLEEMHPGTPGNMTAADLRVLHRFQEVFLQKNTHVLHLVTDIDVYEDVLLLPLNLRRIKEAALLEKLPIRRFEAFRKPFLK